MSTYSSSRRRFLLGQLPSLILLGLGCRRFSPSQEFLGLPNKTNETSEEEIAPGTVAHFLTDQSPVYDPRSRWDFGWGLLLIGLVSQGAGYYHYYVNGRLILSPINRAPFDPSRQTLMVRKNGQIIYHYAPQPRRRPQEWANE